MMTMAWTSTGAALPGFPTLKNLSPSSIIEQVRVGLNSTMPPKTTLDDAWYSTYLIYFDRPTDGFLASGFVVRSGWRKDGRRTLDLVTSDHVIAQGCTTPACSNASVYADAAFRIERDGSMSPGNSSALDDAEFKVIARNAADDLALVRIVVDASVDPRPVRLAAEAPRAGDRVWAIGYPEVYKRATGRGIDRRRVVTRRWSEGAVTGAVAYNATKTELHPATAGGRSDYATDADAMPGSSGGPLLNDAGELTCVLKSAGALPENGFDYDPARTVPSVCVPVANVRNMLDATYGRAFASTY